MTQVATPVADVVAGKYYGKQAVTLTCATSGASMYYTTDGTTPTNVNTPYTDPVMIVKSCTLKAIAIKSGMTDSEVLSVAYTVWVKTNTLVNGTITQNTLSGEIDY